MTTSLRLVALADTHTYQEELGELPWGDVLIHAGDLLQSGTLQELEHVAQWLRAQPHRVKIIVPGNHDRCLEEQPDQADALLDMPGLVILRHHEAPLDQAPLRIWGSPTVPMDPSWAFGLLPGSQALAQRWRAIPSGLDVLVTHGPPLGVGDHGGHLGCGLLRQAVARARPALHLFGHVHQDGGLWSVEGTTYVNVTTWECERAPTVLDYLPQTRQVVPVQVHDNLMSRYR